MRHAPLGAPPPVHAGFGGTEPLAERLFTAYLLPFELTSLLLLVAIVGAVVVGEAESVTWARRRISWYLGAERRAVRDRRGRACSSAAT